jgi:hypothetical protein
MTIYKNSDHFSLGDKHYIKYVNQQDRVDHKIIMLETKTKAKSIKYGKCKGQISSFCSSSLNWLMTRYLLLFDSYGLDFVRRPLWWEGESAFCICCWPSPAQSFSGPSPLGLSQIWDFPFRCLLRLAGSRWRYSTLPPHSLVKSLTEMFAVETNKYRDVMVESRNRRLRKDIHC